MYSFVRKPWRVWLWRAGAGLAAAFGAGLCAALAAGLCADFFAVLDGMTFLTLLVPLGALQTTTQTSRASLRTTRCKANVIHAPIP
jgi:hypothetical protein